MYFSLNNFAFVFMYFSLDIFWAAFIWWDIFQDYFQQLTALYSSLGLANTLIQVSSENTKSTNTNTYLFAWGLAKSPHSPGELQTSVSMNIFPLHMYLSYSDLVSLICT